MNNQSTIIPFNEARLYPDQKRPSSLFFDRPEFEQILNIYGKMVASGFWKDYAISATKDDVTFAVFKRASERPLFRITKTPALAHKQCAFAIHSAQGQIVKRGHELCQVLKYFEKKLIKLIK